MQYFKMYEDFLPSPPQLALPPATDIVVQGEVVPSAPAIPAPHPNIKSFDQFTTDVTIQSIVNDLFASRDLAHQSHLATDSFAGHKALEEYYNGIVELIDTLVETWQGANGEKIVLQLNIQTDTESDIDRFMKLRQKVHLFSETLSSNFSHIKNILDEILHLIDQTIYRLKFLH